MELENTLQFTAPPPTVWDFLLDLERVTPCMPGAELKELVDERTWKGNVKVKVGAVSLAYDATVVVAERDDEARRVVLEAKAREMRGRGMANATIRSAVEPEGESGTRVDMNTDLTVSGPVAQFGRGMIADVSKRLADEFATCLEARLAAPATAEPAGEAAAGEGTAPTPTGPSEPAPAAKPVGGIRLALWALARAVGRQLARLGRAIAGLFQRR